MSDTNHEAIRFGKVQAALEATAAYRNHHDAGRLAAALQARCAPMIDLPPGALLAYQIGDTDVVQLPHYNSGPRGLSRGRQDIYGQSEEVHGLHVLFGGIRFPDLVDEWQQLLNPRYILPGIHLIPIKPRLTPRYRVAVGPDVASVRLREPRMLLQATVVARTALGQFIRENRMFDPAKFAYRFPHRR
jgi:hypothetical protein